MKYIDEYRDPAIAKSLLGKIEKTARQIGRSVTLMEICGSHTYAIAKHGIRSLLPETIRLISGPGCPVCVTSAGDVDTALYLAESKDTIFATFGDMLRVPGSQGDSLQKKRAAGADIRVITSALDCIAIAKKNSGKKIILMGIGFETTAPTIAATIEASRRARLKNLLIFSAHKLVPPALAALISDTALNIDGFICPGHVSTMIGSDAYRMLPESGKAAVITGFEPIDILEGIWMILEQIAADKMEVAIQYSRGAKPEGNRRAMETLYRVFGVADAEWRGIGKIPASGLKLNDRYEDMNALKHYDIPEMYSEEPKGCGCGEILRGIKTPDQCPLFRRICTPVNPIGPCMVSGEGTCAAYYKFGPAARGG